MSELVKNSPSKQELIRLHEDDGDHPVDIDALDSKETFELALAAMKRVTEMVNEGKCSILSSFYPFTQRSNDISFVDMMDITNQFIFFRSFLSSLCLFFVSVMVNVNI